MMELILSGIVVLVTHALEAVTGFGCTVLALPFVTALLGMTRGILLLTILAWILALYIVIKNIKHIAWKELAVILIFVMLGLPVGIYLFNVIDAFVIKKILAGFIIVSATIQLIKLLLLKAERTMLPRWAGYILLFAGGIVHGMFSSGGPFVVLYASGAIKEKSQFRASLCVLWSTLNTIIIVTYMLKGRFSMQSFIDLGSTIPFLIGGIIVGEALHHKVNAKTFSIIVFSMLLATGVIMIL